MAGQGVRKLSSLMQNNQGVNKIGGGIETVVDLVLVIDGTGSMQNCLDAVKERALTLYKDIIEGLKVKNRIVRKIRTKVVIFRDLYVDTNAYEESDYFILSENDDDEALAFRDYISGIQACGGGDEPEHALEALHRVFNLKFTAKQQGQKVRHVVVLMTDASSHLLNDPQRDMAEYRQVYPSDMPRTITELQNEYEEKMDYEARRLVIFAPSAYPWNQVNSWNNTDYHPSTAGKGLSEDDFQSVIASISGSIR